MAFDQNSVPIDLRPINVARVVPEEPRIMQTTATGRNIEGFVANQAQGVCSPNPTPVYYPVGVAEPGGYLGEAFGNLNQGIINWYPRGPVGMAVGFNPPFKCSSSSANLVNQGSNQEWKNDSGDGFSPGKKPKFLCSFGGKILPRPGSGVLRYVGGHTRLIGFKGSINYDNLARKMVETCGQPVTIKYQLPGEDLDALVSIACQEDFDIMMEEYDKTIKSLPDGSAKLRLYLFSNSDADSSALAMLSGLKDNGQRYLEAINGILDESGSVVTRKESSDSAASTQNLDWGGNESAGCSVQVGQGNIVGMQTIGVSSPVGSSGGGMSQENTPRAVAVEPLSSNAADASAVRFGIPAVASSVQILNSELELERYVLPTMSEKMAFETKQMVPISSPHMCVCVAQTQDIKGPGDSIQLPSQIGFPQPPIVGNLGSVFQQHQLLENAVSASPKQFMPAMPSSGTPQVVLRPSAVQQMMHPSQVRRDNYPEGVAYPVRMVPLDPSYYAYPQQVPQSVVGGAYGWNISPPSHAVFHEGLSTPQQVLYTSKVARLDDCYMCQKELPHAHSDSLAQQLKDGNESPTSDSNRCYHSLRSEVNMQIQASNVALTSGGSREILDEQSSGMQSWSHNQAENKAAMPLSPLGVSQGIDTRPENGRTALFMAENRDHTKLPVSQGVVISGGCTPCSAPINNMLQPFPDISFQQYSAPSQFQAKQNDLINMSTYSEILPTENMPSQKPDHLSCESEKETSCKFPGAVPKEDTLELSTDNHRQPNLSTEALRVCTAPINDVTLCPPKPDLIAVNDEADTQDHFGSAFLKNNDEVYMELRLEDAIRLPSASMTTDFNFEHGPSEDHAKQELHAVAEGMVGSNLNAALPPTLNADFSLDDAEGLLFKAKQERVVQWNIDSETQLSPKLEDIKAKLPVKSNVGFPTSDLGRLQIINNRDLEELRELGSGTFGTVYHGKWRGTDVAIKRINERCFQGKPSEQERMRDDFWNEAINLADLHHPNVVAFYGVVLDEPGGSVATVTEYMVNGSLRNALQRNERNLDKRKRILIAMDVAFGMEYLHGKNIVHFDLKSDNLLVNLRDPHRPICKVGDLGLSKVKCHTLISGGVRGTLPWMAPELLNGSSSLVSEKVDVFSFGIVLWELITGEEPYADLHYGAIIGGIVSNTLRPSVPESCDSEWRSLMERCWSSDPSERPSFTGIANQLRAMASKSSPKGQNSGQTLQK
ncbi:unnamed protein product [Rhodiola kirilowii]